jgi:2-phosphoglycerate kinase
MLAHVICIVVVPHCHWDKRRFVVTSVLLIFGSSNVGKSTLAARFVELLGWVTQSTDGMARHPGRPWPEVRDQVAEYYSNLSDDTIYWFLRVHHENMWPRIEQTIGETLNSGVCGAVLEGSALRPEYVAKLSYPNLACVGLFADEQFLKDRIKSASHYMQHDSGRKLLIDKFLTRSLRDNAEVVKAANRLGLPLVDVADPEQLNRFVENFRMQAQQ